MLFYAVHSNCPVNTFILKLFLDAIVLMHSMSREKYEKSTCHLMTKTSLFDLNRKLSNYVYL